MTDAWTARPLTLLIPALSVPATAPERELTVHVEIERGQAGTYLTADALRAHVEECQQALADLDERQRAANRALPLTDPTVDEATIAAQWAAPGEVMTTLKYVQQLAAGNATPGRVALAAACQLDRDDDSHQVELHEYLHTSGAVPFKLECTPWDTPAEVTAELRRAAAGGLATPADVLLVAASEIRWRGRYPGNGGYRPPAGNPKRCPVCAIGAINAVVFGDPSPSGRWSDLGPREVGLHADAVLALAVHLHGERVDPDDTGTAHDLVAAWSDADGRTAEAIADTMEQAAATQAGEGR